MGNLRGFVPASQISLTRRISLGNGSPEERWGKFVGEDIVVSVIEVDRERRRLILSERAASTETRETIKEKVIEDLAEGDIKTGRVTSLADFGAFVNISGADGLVHLSEISWERITNPNEFLKVGQEVKVKIISVDREKKRIGLSIRQLVEDPLIKKLEAYKKGQLVEGTITRLTKFGAFAMLDSGIEGLIHISELSEEHIGHPKEILHEDDKVTLRIIKIEPDSHRIGLSLRRVESLAFADMDMKMLEKELEGSDIKVVPEKQEAESEAAAEEPVAEEPIAEEPAVEETEAKSEDVSEEPEAESEAETVAEESEENTEASGE